MNLFYQTLQLKGFPIVKAAQKLQRLQNLSETDFEHYVNFQKNEILNYHLKHNPYYKSLVGSQNVTLWEDVPVLQKRDLQIPLEQRLSKDYSLRKVYKNKTSGSSGHPFTFAKDYYCHALSWAKYEYYYNLGGISLKKDKQARFFGIPLSGLPRYKERLKDFLSNRYRFSVFDLSPEALAKVVGKFKSKPYNYLNGYTSTIVLFAKYLKQNHLVLKTLCPSLKGCIVTAEMLFEKDRFLLETALGVPVFNEYGAAEVGIIAFQDTSGKMLIDSALIYIEVVDEHGKPLPQGEEGDILLTSLYNKAHPIIRYKVGDRGVISKGSNAKNCVLEQLTGRVDDVIQLPSGKKAAGLTCYYITKKVMDKNNKIKEFVITQTLLNTFIVTYVSDEALKQEEKALISKAFESYLEPDLNISYEKVVKIQRKKSGKLKQFTSLIQ